MVMVNCRDKARTAHRKMKDLKRQVARAIGSKSSFQNRNHFLSEDADFEHNSSDGLGKLPVNFTNNSRAEQTLVTELYKK